MKAAVRLHFLAFTAPLEGVCRHLYLDVKGLVTTGVGNLVDPLSAALRLPWQRPDGTAASHSEIVAEWSKVKARTDMKLRGGGAYAAITSLRLSKEAVQDLVDVTLTRMDQQMAHAFPGWADLPADAQLACLSMSWAVGPGWPTKFPRCSDAVRARDFLTAEQECTISTDGNPGIKPRNVANKLCFRNAHTVDDLRLDADTLWWPHEVNGEPLRPVVDEVLTEDETTPVVGTRIVDFDVVTRLPGSIANDDDEPPGAA
jgi:GH24 family phage-related lysozyme (muramidase)